MEREELLKFIKTVKRGDLIEILEEDPGNLDVDSGKSSTVWRPYYFDSPTYPYGKERPCLMLTDKKYSQRKSADGRVIEERPAPAYFAMEPERIIAIRRPKQKT